MHFSDRLYKAVSDSNSCLLLGIDPDLDKIPAHLQHNNNPLAAIEEFCSSLIEVTSKYICGIKIQMAWFEIFGSAGIALVEGLAAQAQARGLIVVVDAKRSDIGSSANAYAQAYLGKQSPIYTDALTINPWLGKEGMEPFVSLAHSNNKGVFVLVKTSNTSADQLQKNTSTVVADMVNNWNTDALGSQGFGAVGAVVGATRNPQELKKWREQMPTAWLLTPGVGAQGGDMQELVALRDTMGAGVLMPLSRAILYAGSDIHYLSAAESAIEAYWQQQAITN